MTMCIFSNSAFLQYVRIVFSILKDFPFYSREIVKKGYDFDKLLRSLIRCY